MPTCRPADLPTFQPSDLPTFQTFQPFYLPALLPSSLACFTICYHPRLRVARRYLISGRVQGVGFRYFTEAAAAREGLHGWVRNLPDGRVEATAEGESEAVERFERAVRHGPPGARVERVEVDAVPPGARDTGFLVR
jgi:acylphosphatase